MSHAMEFIGNIGNIVHEADGVHIKMGDYRAVTFVSFLAAGTQSFTLRESIAGASEQTLAVVDRLHKAPGVGGAWTEVTQTAGATYTHADATNDMIAVTVFATSLSDGYDSLEMTMGTGTCVAILHNPVHRRDPENVPSPVN